MRIARRPDWKLKGIWQVFLNAGYSYDVMDAFTIQGGIVKFLPHEKKGWDDIEVPYAGKEGYIRITWGQNAYLAVLVQFRGTMHRVTILPGIRVRIR